MINGEMKNMIFLAMLVRGLCRLTGSPLWFTSLVHTEILYRNVIRFPKKCVQTQHDAQRMDPTYVSLSATMRSTFVVLNEMSQQLFDGLRWNLVHILPPSGLLYCNSFGDPLHERPETGNYLYLCYSCYDSKSVNELSSCSQFFA